MQILSLTLENFRGFQLRQIKSFRFTPRKKTQAILGSNGSGKSSLLRELSPLPANAQDFCGHGKKIIEIQHNGKHYVLSSIFDADGSRFSFEVDGENLNPGYTVTVYKELVKEHFNYTADIHALLTGLTSFHSMSVAERRNIFTKINSADFTYAIEYHKRLKENIRNLQGALKRNQDRLVAESAKCLTAKDEEVLRQSVNDLNKLLDTLLSVRKPRLSDPRAAMERLEEAEMALRASAERLEALTCEMKDVVTETSYESLKAREIVLKGELQLRHNEIARSCETIEEWQKEIDAAALSSQQSLEEVQKTIQSLSEESDDVLRHIRLQLHFEDPATALSTLDNLVDNVRDILTELSECPRLDYTKDSYQVLLERRPTLNQSLLRSNDHVSKEEAALKVLEANQAKDSVDCPNCRHRWKPGYDEVIHKRAVDIVATARKQNASIVEAIEKDEKLIREHEVFFDLLQRYSRLRSHTPILESFWRYLDSRNKLLSVPTELTPYLFTLQTDLKYHIQRVRLDAQIKEHVKTETLLKNTKAVDIGKLKLSLEKENVKMLNLQKEMRSLTEELRVITGFISSLSAMERLNDSIQKSMTNREPQYMAVIEDYCIATLDEMIREIRLQVNHCQRQLSQVDIQNGIVKSLGEDIKNIDKELSLLKRAQKALSPSEGLIARGMISFINHFVEELNAYIGSIWLYPLTIQPIALNSDEDVDLDYRFEVLVNNDLPTPDVAKTSKGMQEVIDLAFVAVAMPYLGLSNFPIFLDEFAASFDVAHRQSAYNAIEHLINSKDYSQVFLVSHYQAGYSSLTDAEILVLCDSNVELPEHLAYNTHVTMH